MYTFNLIYMFSNLKILMASNGLRFIRNIIIVRHEKLLI